MCALTADQLHLKTWKFSFKRLLINPLNLQGKMLQVNCFHFFHLLSTPWLDFFNNFFGGYFWFKVEQGGMEMMDSLLTLELRIQNNISWPILELEELGMEQELLLQSMDKLQFLQVETKWAQRIKSDPRPLIWMIWERFFFFLFTVSSLSMKYLFHRNMLYAIVLYVCLSFCLSVYYPNNSRKLRGGMMKLGTIILEVKSNMKLEDGSRAWPLTRWNWRFS